MAAARALKALLVLGTRPEAIKLAPVLFALRASARIRPVVCATAQHRGLLDQALAVFGIAPDHDLGVMVPNQTLFHVTTAILERMEPVLAAERPDLVVVQGDAHSAFAGALAAYYTRTPVAHVEAGLRTSDPYAPFPEEMNRRLIDRIATLLFAPTERARRALLAEGAREEDVLVTGNTEIDALFCVRERIPPRETFSFPGRVVLVTAHRRESQGEGISRICRAVGRLAERNSDVTVVVSVHPNPRVRETMERELAGRDRVALLPPPDYASFVHLLAQSTLLLTDSGGLQEVGAALHIPLLVLREETERMEGVETGAALLVGTDPERIVAEAERLLRDRAAHEAMARAENPYGDGRAAERIVAAIERRFG